LQAQQEFAAKNLPPSKKDDLIFPESLSVNECRLAQMYLRGVDAELHQALLDELAEKIKRYAKTDRRVRNPIGLLCWMCNETKAGRPPLTSDSIHLRERRERDRQLAEREAAACRRLTELALKQGAAQNGLHSAPSQPRGSGGDTVTT
jgi:hypothetical protein